MITLAANETLFAKTDYGNVVYTLFGTDGDGKNPRILAQGFFAADSEMFSSNGPMRIYTAQFRSVTPGASPTIELYADGTDLIGQIYKGTIPDDGTLVYAHGTWTIYNSSGTVTSAPSGGAVVALNTYFP